MAANGGNIKFNVGFNVDKTSLNEISQALKNVQEAASRQTNSGLKTQFDQAATAAKQLQTIINGSWNDKLNQLNLDRFNQSIKTSFGSVQQLKNVLTGAGTAGQSAFNSLASQVLNTNLQLRQSNTLLDDMAKTMGNTVKWGITSSVFNNITGAIQKAFYYAKDLDTSLNDIRIVTGDSADQMERFAKTANNAAKELGRSTLDYTDAALKFYQQGLSDDQVAARTQTTLKAQNITGAGSEMVDYLTAVWNGFNITQLEQTEQVVDKLAKVADSSASDMSQLAIAMSKVASTANTMGVDVDQLTAQLATVIATTRQAPQSVGTAFKAIYSRLNDIKTGADDAEVSLGNYSGKMAEVGFNVLDANGKLRDTGQVMEQIGGRWNTLSREQQVYVAQTMGGMRQVNQVMALFENWTTYSDLLNKSLSAQGTLNQKNSVYLESTAAHMKQLAAETERTYDIMFDQKAVNGFTDVFKGALGLFNDFIEGIGGGGHVFASFGSIVVGVFSKQISESILKAKEILDLFFSQVNLDKFKQKYAEAVIEINKANSSLKMEDNSVEDRALKERARKEAELYSASLRARQGLNKQQQIELNNTQKQIGQLTQQRELLNNFVQLKKQYGYSDLSTTKEFEKEQQALRNTSSQLRQNLDLLKERNILIEKVKNGTASDEEYQRLGKINELLSQNSTYLQIHNRLREQGYKGQELTSKIIEEINTKYKDQQNQIRIVTQLKELQEKYNKGQIQDLDLEIQKLLKVEEGYRQIGNHAVTVQTVMRGLSAAGQIFSGWSGAVKTFGDETATAEQKVNSLVSGVQSTVMAAGTMLGPLGMGIATLANGVLSLVKQIPLVKNGLEGLFESTQEKLDKFQQEFNKNLEQASNTSKNKQAIESLADEFETLSAKAGQYGEDIADLTTEQQNRYREIVDQIVTLNPDIVQGYDDQGRAIVDNNTALEDTIKLLQDQYDAQMQLVYASDKIAQSGNNLKEAEKDRANAVTAANNPAEQMSLSSEGWTHTTGVIQGLDGIWTANDSIYNTFDELIQYFKQFPDIRDKFLEYRDTYIQELNDADGDVQKILEANDNFQTSIQNFVDSIRGSGPSIFDDVGVNSYLQQLIDGFSSMGGQAKELQAAVKETEDVYNQAVEDYQKFMAGAIIYNKQFNSTFTKIKDSLGDSYNTEFQSLISSVINEAVKGFDYSNIKNWDTLDEDVANYVNGALEQVFGNIDKDSIISTQDELEKLLKDSLKGMDPEKYEQQVLRIYQQFLDKNQSIKNMLTSGNEDEYNTASVLVESLFSGFGVKIGKAVEGQLPQITTNVDNALQNIESSIKTAFARKFSGSFLAEDLANWIGSSFNTNQILQIWQGIEDGSLVLSEGLATNLPAAKSYITDFVKGAGADVEDEANQVVENFDKILSAAQKIGSGEELNRSQQNALAQALGLTPTQLAELQSNANWADTIIEQINQTYQNAADPDRIKAISALYPTLQQLRNALDEGKISAQNYGAIWDQVYSGQLAALNINEATLRQYAEAKGLAFNNDYDRQIALNLFKQDENLNKLAGTITKNSEAIKNYDDNVTDGIQAANELAQAFQALGVEVPLDWLIQNIDEIKAAAEDGIITLEQLQQMEAAVSTGQNLESTDIGATPMETYQAGYDKVQGLGGVYDTLSQGGSLDESQLQILSELLSGNRQLNQLAQQKNIYSQEFLGVLSQVLRVSNQYAESERQRLIEENQAQQQKIESQLARLETEENEKENADLINQLHERQNELITERAQLESQHQEYLQDQIESLETIDDLQTARNEGKISDQDFQDNLDDIASKEAKSLGLDPEEVLNYADALQDLADDLDDLDDGLETNRDAALEVAIAHKRLEEGLADLSENFEEYNQQLHSDNISEYAEGLDGLQKAMENVLNIDPGMLSSDYIKENLEDIQLAAQGDIDALDRLREAAAEDIINSVVIQMQGDDQARQKVLDLSSEIQDYLTLPEWKVGIEIDANDQEFLAKCTDMVQAAGMTKEQIQAYFNSLGYDPEIDYEEVPLEDDSKSQGTITVGPDPWGLLPAISIPFNTSSHNTIYSKVPKITALDKTGGGPSSSSFMPKSSPGGSGGRKSGGGGGKGRGGGSGKKGKSDAEKEAQKKRKEDQKRKKEEQRKAEKAEKQAQKQREKAEKQAQKQREKEEKQRKKAEQKAAKQAAKAAEKQAKEKQKAQKQAQKAASKAASASDKAQKKAIEKTIKQLEEQMEKQPAKIQFLNEQIDRYHNINRELEKLERNLDRIADQQDKLFGRDLINNLNEQLRILRDQQTAYETKIDLAKRERAELIGTLQDQGVEFNVDTGDIENYYSILAEKQRQVNLIIAQYNNMTATQQQAYKQTVEQAKDDYKAFQDQIERYEELNNETIPDLIDTIKKARDKQIEIQIEKFKIRVEIEFELTQAAKNFNDFKKKIIDQIRDDDILGNTRALMSNFSSYYNDTLSGGLITSLTDQLNNTMDQIRQINSGGTSTEYGDNKAQALEDLKKYTDELMRSLEDVEGLIKDVNKAYSNMIKSTQSAFSEQISEYNFIEKILDHNKKLSQLLYGQDSYKRLDNYYKKQRENDRQELEFQRQQKDFWWAEMEATKERMELLDKNSNAYKDEQDRFEELKNAWMKSLQDFNSQVENSIQNLLEEYKNNISIIFDDLGNKLTGGKGLKGVQDDWELINKEADMYLDKINSLAQIQKFQDAARAALQNSEGNLAAQRSLNSLMEEQLKFLRDKDKLTQYDVDRANLLLQIEMKRLALEDARQSKSQLRLRRDSQGNYNYQYVADSSAMEDSEEALRQSQTDLYNLDKNQYSSTLNDIMTMQQTFNDKMAQLYEQYPVWTDQAEAKRKEIVERYGNIINDLVDNNNNVRVNLTSSAIDSLASLYNTDAQNFRNMTAEQIDALVSGLVPEWNSAAQEMANTIAGQGGLAEVCKQAFEELSQNTLKYSEDLDLLQQVANEDFDKIAQSQDENIDRAQSLLIKNEELIKAYEEELNAVKNVIAEVSQLANAYMTAKNEAIAATQAAYKFWQQEKQIASEQAVRDAEQKAAREASQSYARQEYFDAWANDESLDQAIAGYYQNQSAAEQRASDAEREYQERQRQARNQARQDQIDMWQDVLDSMDDSGGSSGSSSSSSSSSSDKTNQGIDQEAAYRDSNSGKVGTDTLNKNDIQGIANAILYEIHTGSKANTGWSSDYATYHSQLQSAFTPDVVSAVQNAISNNGGKKVTKSQINQYVLDKLDPVGRIARYASGGYTGSWGGQGKIGVLDEKQLVLNQQDTSNILSAVNIARSISDLLGSIQVNAALPNILSSLKANNNTNSSILDQNVHITATFPAVNSRVEIENAFSDLVNRASQYAFNTRR